MLLEYELILAESRANTVVIKFLLILYGLLTVYYSNYYLHSPIIWHLKCTLPFWLNIVKHQLQQTYALLDSLWDNICQAKVVDYQIFPSYNVQLIVLVWAKITQNQPNTMPHAYLFWKIFKWLVHLSNTFFLRKF